MYSLYFDPGLGAMIIQSIVAAVAAILLFSKNILYKVKAFFGLTKKDNDELFDDINFKESDIDNTSN